MNDNIRSELRLETSIGFPHWDMVLQSLVSKAEAQGYSLLLHVEIQAVPYVDNRWKGTAVFVRDIDHAWPL